MRYYSSTAQPVTLTGNVISSATTIAVNTVSGLPTQMPFTLIIDPGKSTEEIITVTSVAGVTLTVIRGEDGSAAQAHTTGAEVRHMMTARDLREPQQHIDANANVHGVGSGNAIVGTATTQTLRNKTISGADNTLTAIPQSAVSALSTSFSTHTSARIAGDEAGLLDTRTARGVLLAPSSTDPTSVRSGIVPGPGDPLRVRQTTTPSMAVAVNPGGAHVLRTGRGVYSPSVATTTTLTIDPVTTGTSRYDLVYVIDRDVAAGDSADTSAALLLKGTAAASPTKPYGSIPAGAYVLAEVGPVTAGLATVTDSLITNVSRYAAVVGAPIWVRNAAERDELTPLASSTFPITVERLDAGVVERNSGSGWGIVAGPSVWTAYAPTLTSDGGTQPVLGATGVGRYQDVGGVITAHFQLAFGAGGTPGAGNYQISLPVPPRLALAVRSGITRGYDSSTGNGAVFMPAVAAGSKLGLQATATWLGSLTNVSSAWPWTWGPGDILDGFIVYEKA